MAAELAGQDLAGVKKGDGVVEYLRIQAKKNPKAFLPFLGKVLPLQVTGEDGGAIKTVSEIRFVVPEMAAMDGEKHGGD